jgi:hypothetical protein
MVHLRHRPATVLVLAAGLGFPGRAGTRAPEVWSLASRPSPSYSATITSTSDPGRQSISSSKLLLKEVHLEVRNGISTCTIVVSPDSQASATFLNLEGKGSYTLQLTGPMKDGALQGKVRLTSRAGANPLFDDGADLEVHGEPGKAGSLTFTLPLPQAPDSLWAETIDFLLRK